MIGFFGRLKQIIHPFSEIASELRILRELYEAELAERLVIVPERAAVQAAPIRRVTEKPSIHDTEVSYMGVEEKPGRADIFGQWDDNEEEETRV